MVSLDLSRKIWLLSSSLSACHCLLDHDHLNFERCIEFSDQVGSDKKNLRLVEDRIRIHLLMSLVCMKSPPT